MITSLYILTMLFTAAMSFLFSGIETGVLSLNRLRIRQQMREGIKDAKILRNEVDPRLDKYVLEVIYKMPKWTPGILNGNSTSIRMTLPVNFQLDK